MSRDHERGTADRLSSPEIARRAEAGDAVAGATLARYEHRMARALATIINVLDPDVIVLGGGMSNIERVYINVPRIWGSFVFGATRAGDEPVAREGARVRTRLVRAVHGDSSGVRGAARLWPAEEPS
jgi:fructokinase